MLCNAMCDIQYWWDRVALSIWCPLKKDVNTMYVHLIQLQRKPEPKEVDVTYGKKVKDISCRVKTAKEEWKEREAATTQTMPTRIKIFEGGSVEILFTITLVTSADCICSGYIRVLVCEVSVGPRSFCSLRLCFFCISLLEMNLSLSGTNPMKTMYMLEVEAGVNTYVRSVVFAVRSQAC